MKQQFDTYEQAIDKIAEIDELMRFPDPVSGTTTWAVPEKVEVDGVEKWEVILPELSENIEQLNEAEK